MSIATAGVLASFLILLGPPPKSPVSTVLVVDLAHAQVGLPEGKEGLNYIVGPLRRFSVDARRFDFSKSLYPTVRPNSVQLMIGNKRQYSAKWQASGLVELSESTLTPMNDSPPFDGLRVGDQAIIAIGEQRVDPVKHEIVLKLLWAGMVDVR